MTSGSPVEALFPYWWTSGSLLCPWVLWFLSWWPLRWCLCLKLLKVLCCWPEDSGFWMNERRDSDRWHCCDRCCRQHRHSWTRSRVSGCSSLSSDSTSQIHLDWTKLLARNFFQIHQTFLFQFLYFYIFEKSKLWSSHQVSKFLKWYLWKPYT